MIKNEMIDDWRMLTPALMQFYGFKSRATFLSKEKAGLIPKRREFPDGRLGNMKSQCDEWAAQAQEVA